MRSAARPSAQGLRTVVHAHAAEADHSRRQAPAARRSSTARTPSDEALALMKSRGTSTSIRTSVWCCRTTSRTRTATSATGNYNEEGFAFMEKAVRHQGRDVQARAEVGRARCRSAPTRSPARTARTRARSSRASRRASRRWTRSISATSLAAESLRLGDRDRHARRRLRGGHHRRGRRSARATSARSAG